MKKILFIIITLVFTSLTLANDISVWQGQYYKGTKFQSNQKLPFNFTVYNDLTNGTACYTNITNITTRNWGQWKTEQFGVSQACNNASKDYFLNININGTEQTPRRRLTIFNFLRKDANDTIEQNLKILGKLTGGSALLIKDDIETQSIYANGNITASYGLFSYLGSLTNRITKLFVQNIDATGEIKTTDNLEIGGNVNIDGNITTNYGLFSYLGSLTKRITKLFIKNIDVSKDANISGKLQANKYFSGDGSKGITKINKYNVCKKFESDDVTCKKWCILQVKDGLIISCT